MAGVQPPMVPVIAELSARHPGTLSLGQGMVHYAPPPGLLDAAASPGAPEGLLHRYGRVGGIAPLQQLLRAKLAQDNGIDLEGRTLLVTAGGNMAFLTALLAITQPGDEIVLLSPFYFNHEMAVGMASCRAVVVPTDADHQLDLAGVRAAITPRTRAVVCISPNNPTGAVYPGSTLEALARLCGERSIYLMADEAYEYFTYGSARHVSPLSFPGTASHVIGLYSLSKSYGMAGWRIGYLVAPCALEESLEKIQDTNLICPPIACQLAACAALAAGSAWVRPRIAGLNQVRDLVLARLQGLGRRIEAPRPDGAFYVFIRLPGIAPDQDLELVRRLITDYRVAVLPGSTFGLATTCGLRISYGALDPDQVGEALDRLVAGLEALLPG